MTTSTLNEGPLLAASDSVITKSFDLPTGALARGAIVGRVLGSPGGVAAAGNTGNGTIGSISLGMRAVAGSYRVVCIQAAANAGTFTVL